jgi:hypothetical protein
MDRRVPAKDMCDPPAAGMTAHERGMIYPVPSSIRLALSVKGDVHGLAFLCSLTFTVCNLPCLRLLAYIALLL